MLARVFNLLLGQWLIISAFVWPHEHPQLENTIVVGVLCSAIAFFAVIHPPVRRWNMLLAVWLIASTWAMPHHPGTIANNIVVALAMFGLALVRSAPPVERPLTLDERLRIIADAMARSRGHAEG